MSALLVCCLFAAPAAQAADTVDLIVRRDARLTAAERADVRADAGVTHERNLRLSDTEVVSVPAADAAQALRELRADPDVRWVQRDAGASAQASVAADPYWTLLWGLNNTGQTIYGQAGTADADIDAPEAWTVSTGAGVTVAVVDTGADASHEDLAGQLATNPAEMGAGRESNGFDDDGDGLVDDWRGWDFIAGDNDPSDVDGHGSHVSGTIAARNANGKGISGLAPDARVLMLKGLGDDGYGAWSAIADAFDFAGDQGIRVVNASLGGAGYVPVIDDVVAQHANTLYVVSAGNDDADLDATTYYPCESVHANVLCVGASDNRDQKADFSNYSPTAVDVIAPGVDVLSSSLGSYWYFSGTSMAAPHVTAEAALLVARDPTLTAAEIKQAIVDSADAKAALAPYGRGGGRANARAALDLVSPPADTDADGVTDEIDNCPASWNPTQTDADADGRGDACDARPDHDDRDPDADGLANPDDNCPAVANPAQADADHDGMGDACDATPSGADSDGDGVGDSEDRCPHVLGLATLLGCPDSDGDGIGDAEDACPAISGAVADRGCPPVDTGTGGPGDPTDRSGTPKPTLSVPKVKAAKRRRLSVRAVTTYARSATVTVARRRCRRGRCVYKTALTRRLPVTAGVLDATFAAKLPAGRVRVTVTVSGDGGSARRIVTITVR